MPRKTKTTKPEVESILSGVQLSTSNGKKRFQITAPQRELLAKNREVEEAVALFLDPEVDRTNRQIAEQLGMSVPALKRLMQTELFRDTYEEALVDIGHSPRLKNVRTAIDEMLPMAARVIRNIMNDPDAPPGVRLKAAQNILEYAPKDNGGGDQVKEFAAFLLSFKDKSDAVKITVPTAYADAMRQFADDNVVDATSVEILPLVLDTTR
jgi:hypothetical protein